jgi:hypothetical protein
LAAAGALVTALYIFLSAGRHVSHPLNIIFLGAIIVGAATLWLLGWRGLSRQVSEHGMTPFSRFGWFSVLLAVLDFVVAGLVNWVQTREVPLVRPAVLETKSHTLVEGLFIAESSDGVYLGEVDVPNSKGAVPGVGIRTTGRMLHFPRSDVLGLSVGTNQSLGSARAHWRRLSDELRRAMP